MAEPTREPKDDRGGEPAAYEPPPDREDGTGLQKESQRPADATIVEWEPPR